MKTLQIGRKMTGADALQVKKYPCNVAGILMSANYVL